LLLHRLPKAFGSAWKGGGKQMGGAAGRGGVAGHWRGQKRSPGPRSGRFMAVAQIWETLALGLPSPARRLSPRSNTDFQGKIRGHSSLDLKRAFGVKHGDRTLGPFSDLNERLAAWGRPIMESRTPAFIRPSSAVVRVRRLLGGANRDPKDCNEVSSTVDTSPAFGPRPMAEVAAAACSFSSLAEIARHSPV